MRLGARLVRSALGASHWLGVPSALDLIHGRRIRVLCYHGVTSDSVYTGVRNFFGYNLPRVELEQQLAYLKRRCNVVDLGAVMRGRGVSRRRINVMLTFDDGYENNFTNALPALRSAGASGVFGVPTEFVLDRIPLWNDVIEYAIDRTTRDHATFRTCGQVDEFSLPDLRSRLHLYRWALTKGVTMDQERRGEFLDQLRDVLGVAARAEDLFEDADYRPMTPEQVRDMSLSGDAYVGSHSVHHYMLHSLPTERLRAELRESKAQLEELTGRPCKILCLPGGGKSEDVLEEARRAGYEVVFCSDPGTVAPGACLYKRITIFAGIHLPRFADEVHGPVHGLVSAGRKMRGAFSHRLRS